LSVVSFQNILVIEYPKVSFLLLYGELPTSRELEHFTHRVLRHTFVKQSLVDIIKYVDVQYIGYIALNAFDIPEQRQKMHILWEHWSVCWLQKVRRFQLLNNSQIFMSALLGTLYPDANPAINGGDIYNSPMIREKQVSVACVYEYSYMFWNLLDTSFTRNNANFSSLYLSTQGWTPIQLSSVWWKSILYRKLYVHVG